MTYTTIQTPKAENLEAVLYTDRAEWVDYWEALGVWLIDTFDWDATKQAAATHQYNCHGYAWYVSEGSSNAWINYNDRYGNPNLSKYWTGLQSYVGTGSTTNGRKVNYTNDDHSAITTTSSSYVKSKWGKLPRYLHLKSHCPYISTNLAYYELNPNMTGSTSPLCFNVQRTFNTNITHMSQATLTWTPGSYITYVGGAGTPQYTVKGSGNGSSYVNFQISTPSGFSWSSRKNFWAGTPYAPTTIPPGYPTYEMGLYEIETIHVTSAPGSTSNIYKWWKTGSSIEQLTPTWHTFMTVEAVELGLSNFYVKSQNGCGLGATGGGAIRVIDGGGPLGLFTISPNPTDSYFTIDVDPDKMNIEGLIPGNECVLTMVDKMGMVKYTDEFKEFPYRINTSNQPDGLYIINLIYEGKAFSITVVIEH